MNSFTFVSLVSSQFRLRKENIKVTITDFYSVTLVISKFLKNSKIEKIKFFSISVTIE